MEHFCNCCKILIHSEKEKEEHCKTERHQLTNVSDDERNWKYRRFPASILPDMWSICSRYRTTGNCNQGSCEEAHGEDELKEWKDRLNYRKTKLKRVKKAHATQEPPHEAGEKLRNHGQGESYKEMKDVYITVTPEFSIIIKDEDKTVEWGFVVVSQMHLTQISLQPCEDYDYFNLSGVTVYSEGADEVSDLRVENDMRKNHRKLDEHSSVYRYRYTCQVKFTAPFCGIFSVDVAFQFIEVPLLIKQLEVQVTTKEDFAKLSLIHEQIAYFNKWHRGRDITVVPFEKKSNSKCEGRETSNFLYPVPVDHKYFTSDILQRSNEYNYQGRMHQLLYIEEIQQQVLISSYHCVAIVDLIQPCEDILEASNTGENPYQKGELYARVNLRKDLTEDTNEGKLVLNNSDTLLVAPPVRSPQEKKVYEAIIKNKQKTSVLIRLSRACVEDLRLASLPSVVVEVQFQLRAALFCEMHMAVDKLRPVSLVFPDLNIIPQRPWNVSTMNHCVSSHLNSHQRNAVLTITVPLYISLPPIVIAGPFGTGKSMAIFEAVKLLVQDPSNRVLICTYSNSAADAYISTYFDPYTAEGHMEAKPLRLYHYKQKVDYVDPLIQKYCVTSESRRHLEFALPGREYILQYRVVISNLRTSRCLVQAGLEKGYFTHIFIDEAAQAMECEAILPLGLATEDTRIVLAGDPLQVTPKVYSSLARECGLEVSLLRRLWDLYPNNFPCKFLFTQNYSSHEAIVKFVSNEFYGSSTICVESSQPAHEKYYPLAYFPVKSDEFQDCRKTGYYNFSEIKVVVAVVEELKNSWPENWGAQNACNIAVFTPYYEQVVRIRKELRKKNLRGVYVGKVECAQGRQFRAVFLSTVRSKKSCKINAYGCDFGYFTDIERMCSAFIKAQSLIAVVGNEKSLCTYGQCRHSWRKFFSLCKEMKSIYYIPFESSETKEPSAIVSEMNNSHQKIMRSEHLFGEQDSAPKLSYPAGPSSQNSVFNTPSAVLEESSQCPRFSASETPASGPLGEVSSAEAMTPVKGTSQPCCKSNVLQELSSGSSRVKIHFRWPHTGRSNLENHFLPRCSVPTDENFPVSSSSRENRVVRISPWRTAKVHQDENSSESFDPVKEFVARVPVSERPRRTSRGNLAPLGMNIPFFSEEEYEKAYVELFCEFDSLQRACADEAWVSEQANLSQGCEFREVLPAPYQPSLEEKLISLRSRLPNWVRTEEFLSSGTMQKEFFHKLLRSDGITEAKRFLHLIHSVRKECKF